MTTSTTCNFSTDAKCLLIQASTPYYCFSDIVFVQTGRTSFYFSHNAGTSSQSVTFRVTLNLETGIVTLDMMSATQNSATSSGQILIYEIA